MTFYLNWLSFGLIVARDLSFHCQIFKCNIFYLISPNLRHTRNTGFCLSVGCVYPRYTRCPLIILPSGKEGAVRGRSCSRWLRCVHCTRQKQSVKFGEFKLGANFLPKTAQKTNWALTTSPPPLSTPFHPPAPPQSTSPQASPPSAPPPYFLRSTPSNAASALAHPSA